MGIVEVIITAVGYAITIFLFIKGLFDRKKAKDKANYTTTLEYDNSKLSILNEVPDFCAEAEQVVGKGNGPIKELYVTCKVDKLANEKGIIITQDEIKSAIEKSLTAPEKKKL